MFPIQGRVLIIGFVLCCLIGNINKTTASTTTNNNGSNYYNIITNETTTTTTTTTLTHHHYGIANDSSDDNDVLDATATKTKFPLHHGLNIMEIDEEFDDMATSIIGRHNAKYLERASVIYGLTKMASNESELPTICHKQLKYIQKGILRKEPWAMKVLDASGTKPSGFVFGQNFWLGSREACGAVQNPIGITLSKNFQRVMHYGIITERAPFDMDYRVIYLRHNSPWQVEIKLMSEQIIHIGLCLPSVCKSSEIQKLMSDYVERGLFVENDIYDIKPQVLYMKDLKLKESFYQRNTVKLVGAFITVTFGLILCASFLRVKAADEAERAKATTTDVLTRDMAAADDDIDVFENISNKLKDVVKSFDIESNCEKVFSSRNTTANEIPVINGLRSICAIWITIFHVMWYMYFTVNNKSFLISYGERVVFQYVSSAPLLVDVFFTISGFLQTYNFLRNVRQMEQIRRNNFGQNVKQFCKMLFHRYLRLAPLYLVIMGVVDLFYAYISDVSVYHISDRFDEACSRYWWRNMIFIQNLFDHNDMCLNWTWSLACEMQYFILATVVLFIYAKHPRLAKGLVVAAFIATISWTYGIGFSTKFELSFDSIFAAGTEIYISPFVRVLPYILGVIAAWYLMEKQMQFDISDLKEKCLWNLAILVFFVCIYSTIKRDISTLFSISLFVIGRFLFSLSVCWMIIGCATERRSWWSNILEAKMFQHLNRLSYAIYLLNPFVIAFFFSQTSASTHADPFMLCVITSGISVIVYLASIVFSLAFEIPYCNLSSLILKRNKLTKEA